jgi:hypothetical protein
MSHRANQGLKVRDGCPLPLLPEGFDREEATQLIDELMMLIATDEALRSHIQQPDMYMLLYGLKGQLESSPTHLKVTL